MRNQTFRVTPCPYCGEQIVFSVETEMQGVGYWRGPVDSWADTFQACGCRISDVEMSKLIDESEEWEDSPLLDDK